MENKNIEIYRMAIKGINKEATELNADMSRGFDLLREMKDDVELSERFDEAIIKANLKEVAEEIDALDKFKHEVDMKIFKEKFNK